MQRDLLRLSSGTSQTSEHRVSPPRDSRSDDKICDQGRELPQLPGLVRSYVVHSNANSGGWEKRTYGQSDSKGHHRGSDLSRSRRSLPSLCDDPPRTSGEVYRVSPASSSSGQPCQGPSGDLPCQTCAWARDILEHSTCFLVELDDFQSIHSSSSNSDVGEESSGEWEELSD